MSKNREAAGTCEYCQLSILPILLLGIWITISIRRTRQKSKLFSQELIKKTDALERSEFLLRETGRLAQVGGWEAFLPDMRVVLTKEALDIAGSAKHTDLESALMLYPEDSRKILREHLTRCLEDGTPYELELQMVSEEQKTIWVRVMGIPVKNAAGKITGARGVMQNIDDSKTKEIILQESLAAIKKVRAELDQQNELFQTLVEQGSDLYALLSAEGKYVYCSGNYVRVLGLQTSEILGTDAFDLIHPDDIPIIHAAWEALLGQKKKQVVEFRYRSADGQWIWMETIGTNHLDNPMVGAIALSSRDITDRVQRDQELKRSREKFRALFENNPDMVYYQDEAGYIKAVNPSGVSILNTPENKLINRHFSEFTRPEDALLSESALRDAFRGVPIRFEQVMQRQGAETVLLDVTKIPVVVNGEVIGVHTIAKDITESRKHLDTIQAQAENLQLLNEELQAQSEELISQAESLQQLNTLLHEQKVQEQKAREKAERAEETAIDASKAKSIFLANMSHEIRTPMNGVIGMASLLSRTPLDTEQKEYVNIINSSGEALLEIINDILDFSKIESGHMELEEMDFDLRACIEDILDLVSSRSAEKELELMYQMDPRIPSTLRGDPHRLRQVILNLLNNSIKFTSRGEVLLKANLNELTDGQVEVSIAVSDTGIGIPPEKQSRLFQAFSQLDSSTTRKYGGTGLGLAISARLVHLMGGQISVESEPGKGTTFTFTIKVRTAGSSKMENDFAMWRQNQGTSMEALKVLVIDDNETELTILKDLLIAWNFSPIATSSPRDALKLIEVGAAFDLVITDMAMPEITGIKIAEMLHKQAFPAPVILLGAPQEELQKGYSGLFSSMLAKPVKHLQLYKLIQQDLKKKTLNKEEKKEHTSKLDEGFAKKNPLNILLAEDNLINQKLATRILNKLGYQPDLAQNGFEALEMHERKDYDLILMDVLMPEMDGLEATQEIRKRGKHQPKIVAMTANAFTEDRDACIAAGMDGHLSKPVKLDEFVNTLQEISVGSFQ